MGPTDRHRGIDAEPRRAALGRLATLALAALLVLSIPAGFAAADAPQQETDDTYAVTQGDACAEITPFSGNESAKSFYDYRTPIADNPYTNRTGQSFSSKGTVLLQRPNASSVFLYEDRNGTLSLVFLHGAVDNATDGGSATFTVAGLPEDGNWTVKDDEYEGADNYDEWRESDGIHRVDWTWGPNKTDGGVYTGLGDEFEVTVDPAFNSDAALYGDHYNGTVQHWTVLSSERGGVERASLTDQRLTVESGGC